MAFNNSRVNENLRRKILKQKKEKFKMRFLDEKKKLRLQLILPTHG